MAYCTLDDVRAVNPRRTYDLNSRPTAAQVEALIIRIAAEIDTILLGRGVPVPATTPPSFVAHLRQMNGCGAAALAEMGMFPEAEGTPAGSPQGQRLWRIYSEMLAALRTMDLPITVQADAPFSFFERNPSAADPVLKREMIF